MTIGLQMFACFTAGYVFALYEFRGKALLFWLFIMAMSVGRYQLIIPQYVLIAKLGLSDTLLGAALPFVFSPMAVFFFRNYLRAIPSGIVDGARMDGAGEMRILTRVLMPMCRPVFGVVSLFCGLAVVSDYIWPALVLQSANKHTVYVEVISRMRDAQRFITEGSPKIGLGLAGGTLLLIPMVAIFLLTSRYLIDGINTGGVKG
jgi:ABC-type glycerol-3-phosphate transport system permease component